MPACPVDQAPGYHGVGAKRQVGSVLFRRPHGENSHASAAGQSLQFGRSEGLPGAQIGHVRPW